jgi:hypothetical protein
MEKGKLGLDDIRDTVMKHHMSRILAECERARSAVGTWQTRAFFDCLMSNDRYLDIDCNALLVDLFARIERHLSVPFSHSQTRGLLRDFWPISPAAVEKVKKGMTLEVPLERALALKNGWHCQFALLSGYNREAHSDKRKSIDLVVEHSESTAFLIELKEWGCEQHILFAAIEIIMNWYCFIIVRSIDNLKASDKVRGRWPKYTDFKLRVMAPDKYFDTNGDSSRLIERLSIGLKAFSNTLAPKYDVESCELGIEKLHLSKQGFIDMVKANSTVLSSKDSGVHELMNSELLRVILEC